MLAAVEAGAAGYILRDSRSVDLVGSVLDLVAGLSPISTSIARTIVRRIQGKPFADDAPSPLPSLTERETDILWGVAKGLTFSDIAEKLDISRNTVLTHVKNIYRKLEVNSRGEAVFTPVGILNLLCAALVMSRAALKERNSEALPLFSAFLFTLILATHDLVNLQTTFSDLRITLNRVTGGTLSEILGSLNVTGTLYLINPQGVVIGSSGTVVTGGTFVASTRDVADAHFLAGGCLLFKGQGGEAAGTVTNLGRISATGGDVVLIAREVVNKGTIEAPRRTAALASASEVLLNESGDGERVFVRVANADGGGKVETSGRIEAAQVELKVAGGNVYALAGNNGGLVRATGTVTREGRVWLSAGAAPGTAAPVAAPSSAKARSSRRTPTAAAGGSTSRRRTAC